MPVPLALERTSDLRAGLVPPLASAPRRGTSAEPGPHEATDGTVPRDLSASTPGSQHLHTIAQVTQH